MSAGIEHLRLEVLRAVLAAAGDSTAETLDLAAQAMLLVEQGPVAEAPAPRETVAQAIKAGREDVYVPAPLSPVAEAIIATNRAAHAEAANTQPAPRAFPMFSEDRKRLIVSTVSQQRKEGTRPNYNLLATRVNALPVLHGTPEA